MSSTGPQAQRTAGSNGLAKGSFSNHEESQPITSSSPTGGRCMSKEWDASKVPPSRFQKKEGSLLATQSSRDGHVERNIQTAFFKKLKEKKWVK